MSDDKPYVDPNSGAAPQPGGIAYSEAPLPADDKSVGEAERPETETGESGGEGFDPADHNIDEVLAHVSENPDEKDAVLEAEKAGKNRSTLVSQLEQSDKDDEDDEDE